MRLSLALLFALLLAPATMAQVDPALRNRLPAEMLAAGELVVVSSGSFPPYEIVGDDRTVTGASADLAEAVGAKLGLKVRYEIANGFPALLAGIKSGRYSLSMGPAGDFPDRQAANDFIDWVQEFVVFGVPRGNPGDVHDLPGACGKHIAVMAGGSAERVLKQQATDCAAAGKPALEVQSFVDQPTSILAVRSGRSDAFFSSQVPLAYFVQQAHGQLELAGTEQSNGFDQLYQGSVVGKGSALSGVLLETYRALFADGTYARIMTKWGLTRNMIPSPGLDLARMRLP